MLKCGRGNMAKKSVKIQEIRELMAEYGVTCGCIKRMNGTDTQTSKISCGSCENG
jgi:hypothetical protein